MAALAPLSLTAALDAIGNAEIFISTTGITGPTWEALGVMEGERTFDVSYSNNDLMAPEYTGSVVHQRYSNVESARISCNVILGDETLWARINPFQIKGGGYSSFRQVEEIAVALIPKSELGDGLSNADGTTAAWSKVPAGGGSAVVGASSAPEHAIWLPRASVTHGSVPFSFGDGGKSLVSVTFEAMFFAGGGEGYKVFAIGDPNAAGPSYGVEIV